MVMTSAVMFFFPFFLFIWINPGNLLKKKSLAQYFREFPFRLSRLSNLTYWCNPHRCCCAFPWPPDSGWCFMYILNNQFHTSFTTSHLLAPGENGRANEPSNTNLFPVQIGQSSQRASLAGEQSPTWKEQRMGDSMAFLCLYENMTPHYRGSGRRARAQCWPCLDCSQLLIFLLCCPSLLKV